jgi:hypothetical protein
MTNDPYYNVKTMVDYGSHINIDFLVCSECGAVVGDTPNHTTWHQDLQEILDSLPKKKQVS